MKIISLLGAFAVLSFMLVPALSQLSQKSCACPPHDCQGDSIDRCCGKSPDSCLSLNCACLGLIASYSGTEYFAPANSYFSRSSTRSPVRAGQEGLTSPMDLASSQQLSQVAPGGAGPPDPDVVEYLPPSAKEVLLILANEGPLTQKDIIDKTDLPPRTVRYALDRLRGEDMLVERFSFRDARQSLYCLTGKEAR